MCIPLQVVQLTPQGRGAIATLLVVGTGALAAVDTHFHAKSGRSLSSCFSKSNRENPTYAEQACPDAVQHECLVYGHFGDEPGEEVVIRSRCPTSLEIHCLGGLATVAMIQETLLQAGCHTCTWEEWIAQQEPDPISADARVALAKARTGRTAAILLDQYNGALRREMEAIEQALRAPNKGTVPFSSDENRDSPPLIDLPVLNDLQSAKSRIDALLAQANVGLHLTQPWQVVLAGRPNVGKSSLINALLGYPRAIVHPTPGTTRDIVTAVTAMDGWPIELSDTAGLHADVDAVEQAGMEMARKKIATADLVVLLFDLSAPWSEMEDELIRAWFDALVVHTKCDLAQEAANRVPGVITSALTGEGLEELVQEIARRLVPNPPPAGVAVPFTKDQIERLLAHQ
jgi:tRNA modification GTPase